MHELSEQAAARGGSAGRLAEPLADDAELLRKLKPSLIKARARGEEPREPEPRFVSPAPASAPSPKPLPLVAAALGAGVALAKLLDWRGHAHPRD
jgi:hypothetical protein